MALVCTVKTVARACGAETRFSSDTRGRTSGEKEGHIKRVALAPSSACHTLGSGTVYNKVRIFIWPKITEMSCWQNLSLLIKQMRILHFEFETKGFFLAEELWTTSKDLYTRCVWISGKIFYRVCARIYMKTSQLEHATFVLYNSLWRWLYIR